MIGFKQRFGNHISLLLALSAVVTLVMNSFAAPSVAAPASYNPTAVGGQVQAGPTGVLTVTGSVSVNGNPAATGMTILPGGVIQTGAGGRAVIDMGPLGRQEVGQNTTVTVQMRSNAQDDLMTQCGDVTETVPAGDTGRVAMAQPTTARVTVTQGKVTVKYDNNLEKVMVAGNDAVILNVTEVVSDGSATVFEVSCHRGLVGGGAHRGFSPWWFLLAIPVGLGIGLGVTQTGGGPPPVLSPVIPG